MLTHEDSLLHEREAARVLNISIAWLQRARWNGTGPRYVRVGGATGRAIRYRLTDLESYIQTNTISTLAKRTGVK